jgi:DNA-binding transcriptional LysR family regulator
MEWMDRIGRRVSPRDLHVFLAVVEEGSMAKAAARLAVSRPVVSRAVADLERALGVPLLDRAPEGVAPTAYGEALLYRARAVFDELRQGVTDLAALADPNAATLRIGASPVNEAGLVARVIDRLSRRYPRMRFVVSSGTVASRMDALRERRVDIWVARAHAAEPGPEFHFEPLAHERLLVVTAASNPWARRRRLGLAELADEPWIMAQMELNPGSPVVRAFAAAGCALPERLIVSDNLIFRLSLLPEGRHVTFMPDSAIALAPRPPWLRVLPLEMPPWDLPLVVARLRHRRPSPAAELFLAEARAVIAEAGFALPGPAAPAP